MPKKRITTDNCLATLHPEIAQEWHPDKNGPLTPQGVTAGSGQKVWWRCAQGHQWQAKIYNRTPPDPRGCPQCARAKHQPHQPPQPPQPGLSSQPRQPSQPRQSPQPRPSPRKPHPTRTP